MPKLNDRKNVRSLTETEISRSYECDPQDDPSVQDNRVLHECLNHLRWLENTQDKYY